MYVKCSSTLNMDSLVKRGCIGLLVVMLWFCFILITDVSFLITAVKYLWPENSCLFPSGISTFLKTASNTRAFSVLHGSINRMSNSTVGSLEEVLCLISMTLEKNRDDATEIEIKSLECNKTLSLSKCRRIIQRDWNTLRIPY